MTSVELENQFEDKRFYLERFYLRKYGFLGKLFPLTITIMFLVLAYFAGLFTDPEITLDAKISYLFWALFIPTTIYLMTWTDVAIKRTINKANQLIKFDSSAQKNLLSSLYGFPGIIMSILIAAPFIIYDITGFWITQEGWLNDIAYYFSTSDNSWYPRITETTNGIGFGSLLWLIICDRPVAFYGCFYMDVFLILNFH